MEYAETAETAEGPAPTPTAEGPVPAPAPVATLEIVHERDQPVQIVTFHTDSI